MATLADLKLSLRIDGNEDDTLLKGYLLTAENYIKNAVAEDASTSFWQKEDVSNLLDTASLALASTYYSNRSAITSTSINPIDLTLNAIIGSLRGKYVYCQEEGVTDG